MDLKPFKLITPSFALKIVLLIKIANMVAGVCGLSAQPPLNVAELSLPLEQGL
jgi:hypothetical protein